MESSGLDAVTAALVLAQDGDLQAASRVLAQIQPEVRRFIAWFGSSQSDIDDLVQETLLRVFKGLDSFRIESRGMAWVLTIARRVCLDKVRTDHRERQLISALQNETWSSDTHLDTTRLEFVDLISQLPTSLREAFVLVKLFGFSYAETASILNCPIGTVQSRIARARVELATLITQGHIAQSNDRGSRTG